MIYIDYRTGSKELAPYISAPCKIGTLDFGDVSFVGMGDGEPAFVGIERKTLGDFLKSVDDGRLSGHQLIGMLEKYNHPYLLIEGLWRANPQTGALEKRKGKSWVRVHHGKRKYQASMVYNYVNTLSVMCGVTTVCTSDIRQSGKWIDSLYSWWQKPWDEHKSHLKMHKHELKPRNHKALRLRPPTPFERIISNISGVGFSRATLLEKHFHTPMALALATEKQLLSIKGIGRQTAGLILKELRGQQ